MNLLKIIAGLFDFFRWAARLISESKVRKDERDDIELAGRREIDKAEREAKAIRDEIAEAGNLDIDSRLARWLRNNPGKARD